jgi:uncharacterized repeat protein (TIGR02543 family)
MSRLSVATNNAGWGIVSGTADGVYPSTTGVTLTAQPAEGYAFVGWTSGNTILGTEATLSFTLTQDMQITAEFAVAYTVTLRSGAVELGTQVAIAGDTVIRPADPEALGYTFAGWYIDSTLLTAWSFSTGVVTGNMTLYAKWTIVTYSISYHLNGESYTDVPDTTYTVEDNTISLPSPYRSGYAFAGWYANATLSGAAVTSIA